MSALPYRIERTTNRTSRAHLENDTVVIRLAGRMPRHEEERHIATLLRRMARAYAKRAAGCKIDPFRDLLNGASESSVTLADGTLRNFIIQTGKRTRARFVQDTWHIECPPATDKRSLHRFLWKLLSESERERIQRTVERINRLTLNVSLQGVSLGVARVRWGSCSRRGTMRLNTALLFVPEDLLHYVIVHELAHIPHPNHSPSFWQTVERFVPDCKMKVKQLKTYHLFHF